MLAADRAHVVADVFEGALRTSAAVTMLGQVGRMRWAGRLAAAVRAAARPQPHLPATCTTLSLALPPRQIVTIMCNFVLVRCAGGSA